MSTKRFDVYAPVIIPTLCRYEHFKRCIESLSRCTGAEYTEVYIGLDYPLKKEHEEGYKKICEYIPNVCGFKEIIVYKREKNYGFSQNTSDIYNHVREKYDRYIFSEDDNEFSPNFLEYMNEGLTRFKDTPNVIRICGAKVPWSCDLHEFVHGYDKNVFPAKDFVSSGVGAWFDKLYAAPYTKMSVLNSWKLTYRAFREGHCTAISRMLHQLKKESQLPDVCRRLFCAFNNYYCIFPIVSKVKNWGYDGTGLNSDNDPHLIDMQEFDSMDSFYMDDIEIKDYPGMDAFIKKNYSDGALIRFVTMIKYLYYRISKKDLGDTAIYKTIKNKFKTNS